MSHACAATVPGDAYEMQELRRRINEGEDAAALVQACDNMHTCAGMLKMFFRELTEPVLSFAMYDECILASSAMGAPSETTDTSTLKALLARLPPGHFEVLRCLMLFLGQVVRYTPESKMTVGNTAAVFAPNLLRSEEESIDQLADTVHVVNLVAVMIQLADRVFDVPGPSSAVQPAAAAAPPSAGVGRPETVPPRPAETQAEHVAPVEHSKLGQNSKWYFVNAKHQQEGPVRHTPRCLARTW